MSRRTLSRLALLFAVTMAWIVLAPSSRGGEPGPEAARLESFTHADGANYFALTLKPAETKPAAGPHDVVVLFDTSASQAGDYRVEALAALESLLGDLQPEDRVHLMAVDVNAIGMTEGFVAPDSPEMAAALEKLEARVPLGATDMEKALTTAVAQFAEGPAKARAAVYIGDGMSTANLLGSGKFEQLAGTLADNQIPVSSYAIGPRLDVQLLGALAANTGGQLIDGLQITAEDAGGQLAAAARATVVWPKSVTWPAGFAEVFPRRTPPLRADRETVVIGTYKGQGPFDIQMTVDTAAGAKPLSWTVTPNPPRDANSYIARMVETARIDGGMSLPLVGAASLKDADRAFGAGLRQISQLAVQALRSGDLANAERLAQEALRQDPEDNEARIVLSAVQRRRAGGPAPGAAAAPALNMVGPGAAAPGGAEPEPAAMINQVERERNIIIQKVTADVTDTVEQAGRKMDEEPAAAIQDLKVQLESVRRVPELDPEVREQLIDQLQAVIRRAERQQVELEQRRQQQYEILAIAKERTLTLEKMARDQQKLKQLMERFNSLMDEGRYRFAEEQAALQAQEVDPDDPVPIVATHVSRTVGYYQDAMVQRVARQKGVIDTLWEVEKSHIPTPDEPPILYPPAEIWQELSNRRKREYSAMSLSRPNPAEKRINEQLKEPTKLEFFDTPLADVVATLKDMHGIEIQLDQRALEEVGIPTDMPITMDLKGVSLRSALRLMLRNLDLTYTIEDEVLLITTIEEAELHQTIKVYPVADLVIPVMSTGMMGGFGGMGGWGGGMGMMGGGGGWGGGGGMRGWGGGGGMMGGGGWGGGGGMMGGGGMWNLPQDILPQPPVGGFRAFSVKDDLKPSNKPQHQAAAGEPATIRIDESVGPQVFWDRHFAQHKESPATIREAVRELGKAQKFDHVIALIQAALRHHPPQPWMYEAMGLAMQADGRPKEEIERAVMSAVDFIENPLDLMYIGVYLDRIGLERRALKIYQQVAELVPTRHEPYMHGLKVAQRLDDLEGVKWAAVGILRQAWPEDKREVWLAGFGAAEDTLKRLRQENRQSEADQFEQALMEAVQRDLVVEVSWSGPADVDIMMEEPSGTVCSFRNPRTTAGGVMLGDTFSGMNHNPAEGFRETYVCPEGFSGNYRMLLRRVWGNVTADKVAVTIYTNLWSDHGKVLKRMVSLADDEAVVQFNLDEGRRKELLREQQVANAAVEQLAVRHHILAQQLAGAIDPRSMASFSSSRQRPFVGGIVPVVGGGAVGYQPVIITLPEGTNLMATGVISADRRYVRVTALPYFSGVAEVNTFNTATGQNVPGIGGTGGAGFSGLFGGGRGMGGMGGFGF